MKKNIFFALLFCFSIVTFSQSEITAYKDGEWLQYKMSYSGFLTAGTASLELKEETLEDKEVFHAIGKGWTTGMIKWFFKVDDLYQSYFDKASLKPYVFKRKIDEGGYKKNRNTYFNYQNDTALVQDYIQQKETRVAFKNVQDMMSSFYYLRNQDVSKMEIGDVIKIDMFLDAQVYPFRLKFLGTEIIKTRFGKVSALIFRPLVQSGRVFKAEESVTIWITNDNNKIPIRLKADLSVGSLRAELSAYKGLANSFKIIFD